MHELSPIDAFKLLEVPSAGAAAPAGRPEARARARFGVAQALAQGRVGFHYQPVVQARNPRTPAFFEVLARLTTPSGETAAGRQLPAGGRGRPARPGDRPAGARARAEGAAGQPRPAALDQHVAAVDGRRAVARDPRRGRPRRQRRLRPADPRDHRGGGDRGRRPDHRLHEPRAGERLRLRARRLRRRRHRLQVLPRLPLRHGEDRRQLRRRGGQGPRRPGADRVPGRGRPPLRDADGRRAGRGARPTPTGCAASASTACRAGSTAGRRRSPPCPRSPADRGRAAG